MRHPPKPRECARCGEALVDDCCPKCSARKARWAAYAIIAVLAVVAPILSILLAMNGPPLELAWLPALLIGSYAVIRAIAMTDDRRERSLFILFVLAIAGFGCILALVLFYLWIVWAYRGG